MRGSILAVLAIAILAGLGTVAGVRYLGLLNPPPVPEPPPPPPPVVEAPPPPPPVPQILVSARNVYPGEVLEPEYLQVRPLRPEEKSDYEKNKADYLPANPSVFYFRFLAKEVPTDQPLRFSDLAPPKPMEALHSRLFPGTRALSVSIPKHRSAGGLIQVGDWVDVYLTTEVRRSDSPTKSPYTALLIPHALVVAKRDTLYPLRRPLPPGEPIEFMLATNPYRAALLEYGRTIGQLSLVPVAEAEKRRLDELREQASDDPSITVAATFAPPGSPEYKAEVDRIRAYENGVLSIGSDELAGLLKLPPIPTSVPAPPKTIEIYSGVSRSSLATFPVMASTAPAPVVIPQQPSYLFAMPQDVPSNKSK
jgi:Flp pilus assembly protein CpaB